MRARLIGGLPDEPRRLAHRPDAGHVPGLRDAPATPTTSPSARPSKRVAKGRNAALPVECRRAPPRHQHLRQARLPGRRRPGRPHRQDGHAPSASAASSSSATSTATPTRTRTSSSVADRHPVPKAQDRLPRRGPQGAQAPEARPEADAAPPAPASRRKARQSPVAVQERGRRRARPSCPQVRKERLFAAPKRPAAFKAGGKDQLARRRRHAGLRARSSATSSRTSASSPRTSCSSELKVGSKVIGGTILGRIGKTSETHRRRTCCSRSARPAAAPRASTRSRSSTAGSCSSRPRSTAPRARTRSSAATPRRRRSARSC